MAAFPAPSSLFPTISHNRKRAFLLAYAETGQLRRSCRALKMDHALHYYWMDTDPAYADAFAQAQAIAAATLEEEAIRRARDGVKRTVYYQGEPVGEEFTYSDTLLIFLMKGAMPEKYGDKHEVTGKDGTDLVLRVVYDQSPSVPELPPPQEAVNGQRRLLSRGETEG